MQGAFAQGGVKCISLLGLVGLAILLAIHFFSLLWFGEYIYTVCFVLLRL